MGSLVPSKHPYITIIKGDQHDIQGGNKKGIN